MFSVKKLTKEYRNKSGVVGGILDVSFDVKEGEIICVLGGSGSGKSTLLKTIAGIEKADKGTVSFDNPEHQYTYVSQTYTLWPHLTVLENLTLAPSLTSKRSKTAIERKARSLLNRFGLKGYAESYPEELSGGQQQRVALLRAVMQKPKILLLDEVTSALDPNLTKSVLDLIRALAKDGYTMVVVTHHMSFALSVADRVLFLKDGRVLCNQATTEFFTNQKNEEVREFILDIAKKDEQIEVFKGIEQFQAYHLGLMRRLPENSTIYVAGGVADKWYGPMGDLFGHYTELRLKKNILWKMVMYEQGETDRKLQREYPKLNQFRQMPRTIQNPANYNVFGDTVITQIFEEEPTIIQIKNQNIADAYKRFFEELWDLAK